MNAKKYILILSVALFAAAVISAFGADTVVNTSTGTEKITAGPDISDAAARLNNTSRAVAAGAVKDLAKMRTEQATRALIGYIRTSKDDYMRIQVIEMLAVNPSTSTAPALVEAARDPNPYVRMAAVKTLGFRPDAESLTELNRALFQDKDISVKKFALHALGLHTSSAAVTMVDNVLADKSSSRAMRVIAARVLNKINIPYAKTTLAKYKNDTDSAVKNEANSVQAVIQTKQKKGK